MLEHRIYVNDVFYWECFDFNSDFDQFGFFHGKLNVKVKVNIFHRNKKYSNSKCTKTIIILSLLNSVLSELTPHHKGVEKVRKSFLGNIVATSRISVLHTKL